MNGRDGKNSNRSATKMSETKTAEEPFFACLRTLKTLLQPQSPLPEISVHIRASQQTTRSIARDHPRNEGTAPPESPVSPQHAEALSALQSKLHAAEETARKERTFRLSVEKEREDLVAAGRLLNEKLETKSASKVPWRDDINYLKKENERLRTAREEERKKHFEEMDHVHEQLQSAISQRDSMEARLLGNRTFIDELQAEARKAQYEIQSQEQLHTDTMQSLQNQNNNLSISVEKLHHTIVAIQNELSDVRNELEETQSVLRQVTERTGEDKERVDASSRGKKNKPESLQASANISGATEVQADAKELIALRQEVERLRNELSQARHDIESSQDMVQSLQQQIVRNQRTAAEADAGDQEDSKALQQRLISAANAEQNSKILELWQEKGERDEEQDYVFWKQLEDLKKQSPEQRRALAVAREQLDKSQQLPGSTAEKLNSTEEDRNFESFARKRDRSGVADLGEGGASDGAERVDCEIVVDAQ